MRSSVKSTKSNSNTKKKKAKYLRKKSHQKKKVAVSLKKPEKKEQQKSLKKLSKQKGIRISGKPEEIDKLLINAITEQNILKVKNIIKSGKLDDPNKLLDDSKKTFLHLVIDLNNNNMVKILLTHPKINPNIVSNSYGSPLYMASMRGYIDIVNILLGYKGMYSINPNIGFYDYDESDNIIGNNTPLIIATENGRDDIVSTLLDNHADPNIADSLNNTPLHIAAEGADLVIVKKLITAGADPSKKNGDDEKPIDVAKMIGHLGVITYLQSKTIAIRRVYSSKKK